MTNNTPRYFVPAAPGFWVLGYLDAASGGPGVTRQPVVAWEMVDDIVGDGVRVHYAYPMTTFCEVTHYEHNPILGPDGRVRLAGDATWDSEGQWLEEKKKGERAALKLKETTR